MKTVLLLLLFFTTVNADFMLATESENGSIKVSDPDTAYTILVLYRATNHWLTLSREERNEFAAKEIFPIIQKFDKKLNVRLFDSEAFHAKTSDFFIVSCNDLKDYYFFMECLRDTDLFAKPYIELNDIIIGIEGGFKAFESSELYRE